MKIITVVGARPQFIKAAVVSRILRQQAQEVLVHTGQHYDYNMSEIFFKELDIPHPDYNLGISGGSHAKMLGAMLPAIEDVLLAEKPNAVLVYGDTNSTLAAALTAVKMHIPVCHVEAGCRLGVLSNPEEINRVCTDHISSLLLSCTELDLDFLNRENLGDHALLVGDPMLDAFVYYGRKVDNIAAKSLTTLCGDKINIPSAYYYLTCHREENSSEKQLTEILKAANSLDCPVVYPVHPRNQGIAQKICSSGFMNVLLVQPVGYLTSLSLVKHAKKIITDSGGLVREAFFAQKPCVTIFNHQVWPQTYKNNCNQMVKADSKDILDKLAVNVQFDTIYQPFGDGNASKKIVAALLSI